MSGHPKTAETEEKETQQLLVGKAIHEIADFVPILKPPSWSRLYNDHVVANWLNRMFGKPLNIQ